MDTVEEWLEVEIPAGTTLPEAAIRSAEYVPVRERFSNATFDERWVRRRDTDEIWRIVDPDYPFFGAFEPVEAVAAS